MAVSQKQIAERLGVSIALVSRVLSGKARDVGIADATIERVVQAAQEMGYVPSAAALTLKGKSSNTIGVVVYDFQDPFFGAIIEQLQAQAHEQGYSLVLAGFKGRHPEASDLAPLHKHAIDGLIVIGSAERADWLEPFSSLPVARIGHGHPSEESVRIAVDETDAARRLLGHLASKGVGKCAYIGSNLFAHSLRYRALEKVAGEMGLEVENHVWANDGFDAGVQAARNLLSGNERDIAFVCATDLIAMGALHSLYDIGISLPVTGFDDIPSAGHFIPSLTTFHQPIRRMSAQAFEAIIGGREPCVLYVDGSFIAREST